ncbi:hypothetical protein R8Z50_01680 [Longispora sp. K20-0274]|uniref:WXG100-like domain-containing protein n=1 Tax=Longispora sp. K20-0274 TaxID=3088255 RepID=UPI0039997A5F
MGIQPPHSVVRVLTDLGFLWPEADEEKLFQMGLHWVEFGAQLSGFAAKAQPVAQSVWQHNKGEDIDAFQKAWNDKNHAHLVLTDGAQAAMVIGACFMICAIIVLALKIMVIVQIVILIIEIIQAFATAVPTFGASLLEIPVFKAITGRIIGALVSEAIGALLG